MLDTPKLIAEIVERHHAAEHRTIPFSSPSRCTSV